MISPAAPWGNPLSPGRKGSGGLSSPPDAAERNIGEVQIPVRVLYRSSTIFLETVIPGVVSR